jgi:hypothetical protein
MRPRPAHSNTAAGADDSLATAQAGEAVWIRATRRRLDPRTRREARRAYAQCGSDQRAVMPCSVPAAVGGGYLAVWAMPSLTWRSSAVS